MIWGWGCASEIPRGWNLCLSVPGAACLVLRPSSQHCFSISALFRSVFGLSCLRRSFPALRGFFASFWAWCSLPALSQHPRAFLVCFGAWASVPVLSHRCSSLLRPFWRCPALAALSQRPRAFSVCFWAILPPQFFPSIRGLFWSVLGLQLPLISFPVIRALFRPVLGGSGHAGLFQHFGPLFVLFWAVWSPHHFFSVSASFCSVSAWFRLHIAVSAVPLFFALLLVGSGLTGLFQQTRAFFASFWGDPPPQRLFSVWGPFPLRFGAVPPCIAFSAFRPLFWSVLGRSALAGLFQRFRCCFASEIP